MNLLHFDVEGGWGGSSISLFEITKKLKKTKHKSFIVCRKKGPIQRKYKQEKIKYFIENNLYSFIPRKNGKNIKNFIGSITQLIFFPLGIINVIKIIKKNKINIIHINYEGFFLLALILKLLLKIPIIFHIRTQFPEKNFACKIVVLLISRYIADYIFFITDREKFFFQKYENNTKIPRKVLFNISSLKRKNKFKSDKIISYFGNISYEKGVDRILDIAKICKKKKLKYKFQIFGKLNKNGYGSDYHHNLKKSIIKNNLTNIKLMGHVTNPEIYLSSSFLLIRLSRVNDPWGRDVIEALTLGVPAIATGSYEGIIKNNLNGFLIKKFSSEKVVNLLEKLFKNKKIRDRLSSNCNKIKYKFDGSEQIKIFENAINFVGKKIL